MGTKVSKCPAGGAIATSPPSIYSRLIWRASHIYALFFYIVCQQHLKRQQRQRRNPLFQT